MLVKIKKGYLKPRCGITVAAMQRKAGPMHDKRKDPNDYIDECDQCRDGSGVYYFDNEPQECICVGELKSNE